MRLINNRIFGQMRLIRIPIRQMRLINNRISIRSNEINQESYTYSVK